MSARHNSGMTPQAAAAEIDRTARQVRRRARWQGWLLLAVAVVNFGFYIAIGSADRTVSRALSPLPILLAVVIFLVASRQPVVGRDAARINRPVVVAALATAIAGLVLYQTVMPQGFTGWLVLLAAFMVTPFLAGAWRWLRS
jgi:cation transport ATPase